MKLKKLELYGFKSFADRIEIQFDEGITAIVGPNGSGKSNIGDAMRWVLGEQNARVLRGTKMEDVIFNGTAARKPLSYCEVSITFDNSDGSLPVEYSEVNVVRRAFRNGDSEYYINKKSCRMKDIVDLFRDTGIGREGYSIIGQGRITEIINSRPEDRRGAFHESAGIMKYRSRKEEAERSLERTRDNMTRLADIVSEIQGRLEPLRIQSENARRYLQISTELKELEVNHFLLSYETYQNRIKDCKEQLAQEEVDLARRTEQVDALDAQTSELTRRIDQLGEEITLTNAQLGDYLSREERRAGEERLIRERIKNLEAEANRLEQSSAHAKADAEKLLSQARDIAESLENGTGDTIKRTAQIETMEKELNGLGERLRTDEEAAEAGKDSALEKVNRAGDIKGMVARLDALSAAAQERIAQADAARTNYENEKGHIREAMEEIENIIARLRGDLTEKMRQNNEKAAATEAFRQSRQQALGKTGELREKLQAANTRLNMLNAMSRDYEGYADVVRRLLTDSRNGLTGKLVEGVVAEILEVPQEIVRAVEMALGGAMQQIITADEQDAKALIEYLRKNNYGRATFLPVSAVRGRTLTPQERSVLRFPNCLGVASELVKYDHRYEGIVQSLLGRTVVSRDMDSAIAMARSCSYSLRFVTLEGDVINSGGSMSGGSVRSRYTSILGRKAEIERMEQSSAALKEEIRTWQEKADAANAAVDAAKGELAGMEADMHELQLASTRENERRERAKQNLARVDGELEKLDMEISQLQDNLSDIARQKEQAQSEQQEVEQSGQAAREEMIRLQQAINARREEYAELQEQINRMRIALAADESQRESLTSDMNRMKREAKTLLERASQEEGSAAESKIRLETEQLNLQQNSKTTDEDREGETQLRQALAEHEGSRTRLRVEREKKQDELNGLRKELEAGRLRLNRTQVQSVRAEGELENLQNRIWDHYELTYANALPLRIEGFDAGKGQKRIAELRAELTAMGSINVGAVEEYAEVRSRYDDYTTQIGDMQKAEQDLVDIITDLTGKMEERFRQQFTLINQHFHDCFQEMFGGGTAQLVLTDEENVLDSGIEIQAQPPGKHLRLLSLLSGGENALTALALLFAFLRVNPSPFCLLDEVETALDDANVSRFANYVKNVGQGKNTQFMVVTHRKGTMEVCNAMYGVTMEEKGVSKVLSMKMAQEA